RFSKLLELVIFFKYCIEMPYEKEGFPRPAINFSKKVPRSIKAIGHSDPPGGETKCVEFTLVQHTNFFNSFQIECATVYVDRLFNKINFGLFIFTQVFNHFLFGSTQRLRIR